MDSINPISKVSTIRSLCTKTPSEEVSINKIADAVTGKILYCNGMTTSEELALNHAKTIADLTGVEVELHHNNTTSTEKALKISGKLVIGCLAVSYTLATRKRFLFGVWLSRIISLTGLVTLTSGMIDLNKIDKEKDASAQILAGRISAYLDAHPLQHMTLIFHSQGADIGHRALEKLTIYKDRISVVTIGGVIDIPDSLALRVVNFVNDNDMIAYLAKTLFDSQSGKKTKVQIKDRKSRYLESHYSSDYLRRPEVKQTILDLVKSNNHANRERLR
jgi:hypothetical protein